MTPTEIREARKSLRLTQSALGEALGVSRKTVNCWEQGVHPIRRSDAREIGRMLESAPRAEQHRAAP